MTLLLCSPNETVSAPHRSGETGLWGSSSSHTHFSMAFYPYATTIDATSGLAAALSASYAPLYGPGAIPAPTVGPVVHRDEPAIAASLTHNHAQVAIVQKGNAANLTRQQLVHGHARQVVQQGVAVAAAADGAAARSFAEQEQVLRQQQQQAQQFFQTVYATQQRAGDELVRHAQSQFAAQAAQQSQQDTQALQQAHLEWQQQYSALGFQPDPRLAGPFQGYY
eukprot:TRINITY_DN2828_c0_g1_i4.p1 TRINITY_DN2828_c0_g1~~TRINITY_DN2828_c0_g1_i4.p1  ORF type:complete len:223 (-),score=49.29 TRINITY_DN2828_c0_g1_i4:178-846(-)